MVSAGSEFPSHQYSAEDGEEHHESPPLRDILRRLNRPVRFKYSRTVTLRLKRDVVKFLVDCITNVGMRVRRNRGYLKNPSPVGSALVCSALQVAYRNARVDVFTYSGDVEMGSGDRCFEAPSDEDYSAARGTIAGSVLNSVANSAEPSLFAGAVSAFLAYGVNFTKPRREGFSGMVRREREEEVSGFLSSCDDVEVGSIDPLLPPLDEALWCLHAVVEQMLAVAMRKISDLRDVQQAGPSSVPAVPQLGGDRSGDGESYEEDSEQSEQVAIHLLLQRAFAVLMMLYTFARDDVLSADSVPGCLFSAHTAGGGALYTVSAFCCLFKTPLYHGMPSFIDIIKESLVRITGTAKAVVGNISMVEHVGFDVVSEEVCRFTRSTVPHLIFSIACISMFPPLRHNCTPENMTEDELEAVANFFRTHVSQLYLDYHKRSPCRSGGSDEVLVSDPFLNKNVVGKQCHGTVLGLLPLSSGTNECVSGNEVPEGSHGWTGRGCSGRPTGVNSVIPGMFMGLRNAGNTCFMNSFLQVLFTARHFIVELVRGIISSLDEKSTSCRRIVEGVGCNAGDGTSSKAEGDGAEGAMAVVGQLLHMKDNLVGMVALTLSQMHWRLRNGFHCCAVDTTCLQRSLPQPFNNGRQHDASEFAMMLMDRIDNAVFCGGVGNKGEYNESWEPSDKLDNYQTTHEGANTPQRGDEGQRRMLVSRWFGGTLVSTIRCQRCGTERSQRTPFWNVTVPLRFDGDNVSRGASLAHPPVRPSLTNGEGGIINTTEVVQSADGRIAITTYHTDVTSDKEVECGSDCTPCEDEESANKLEATRRRSLQELLGKVLNYRESREVLQGDNMLFCDVCCSNEPAEMCTAMHGKVSHRGTLDSHLRCEEDEEFQERVEGNAIEGIPHYLILQLNRFQYSHSSGCHEKVMDRVSIEREIDVPVRVETKSSSARPGRCEERGAYMSSASDLNVCEETCEGEGELVDVLVRYELRGVLVHNGPGVYSGHYFSLVFHPQAATSSGEECRNMNSGAEVEEEGVWALANDSSVTLVPWKNVSSVLTGSGSVVGPHETPYMVLYERCYNPATDVDSGKIADIFFPDHVNDLFHHLHGVHQSSLFPNAV